MTSYSAATEVPSGFVTEARMVTLPAATPVTRPLPSTVATDGSSEAQTTWPTAPLGESVAVRLTEANSATVSLPPMVMPVNTGAVTSIVHVCWVVHNSPNSLVWNPTVAVPAAIAVTLLE